MNGRLRAALWMAGALTSFSAMALAGRAARVELPTFELMLYRSLVGFVIVVAGASVAGTLSQVRPRRMGLHLARNACHFTGQNLWFYAISVAPLAQVFALEFTTPVWVALLAPLVVAERLTRRRLLAAMIGFAGVLIVARPNPAALDPGALTAAASAIGFAGSALFTKRLTGTESITQILFWLTAMQAVMGLVCALHDGVLSLPSPATLLPVGLIGAAGLSAHFCLTRALSHAPATIVMPMDFLRLPLIAVIGMMFYAEPLDWAVLAGGLVVLGANFLNLTAPARQSR